MVPKRNFQKPSLSDAIGKRFEVDNLILYYIWPFFAVLVLGGFVLIMLDSRLKLNLKPTALIWLILIAVLINTVYYKIIRKKSD